MEERGRIDIIIFLVVLGLMLFSLIVVYSASSAFSSKINMGDSDKLLSLHIVKIFIGIAVLFFFFKMPIEKIKNYTKIFLLVSIGVLCLTIVIGSFSKGATRAISFGSYGFMSSDFARLALILHLSTIFEKSGERIKDFKEGFLKVMFWIISCAILIVLQPNFSTAVIVTLVGLGMLYVGGAKGKHLLYTFLIVIPIAIIVIYSAQYRQDRFVSYVNSLVTGEPINSQVYQAHVGFGSGGTFGVGMGESKQKYFFLPESYGDFIFAVIGEEYGFIGTMIVLLFYLLIVYRGFKIAQRSTKIFHKMLAFGFTFSFGLYAFINAAVTLGLIPTTGIALPFLSYGGSSIIANAAGIGIVLNISSYLNTDKQKQDPLVLNLNETN